jgi:hypothetical protein
LMQCIHTSAYSRVACQRACAAPPRAACCVRVQHLGRLPHILLHGCQEVSWQRCQVRVLDDVPASITRRDGSAKLTPLSRKLRRPANTVDTTQHAGTTPASSMCVSGSCSEPTRQLQQAHLSAGRFCIAA